MTGPIPTGASRAATSFRIPASRRGVVSAAALALACAAASAAHAAPQAVSAPTVSAEAVAPARFDPERTRFGFSVRTRWGQRVEGTFDRYAGEITTLADGRQRVRIALQAASVQVGRSDTWSAMARGPRFFDAQRHPTIEFVSDPFAPALLRGGGALRGTLSLGGVRRVETFELDAAPCERPGRDCEVTGRGVVSRRAFGLTDWAFALGDRVRFSLQVRVLDEAAP